LASNADEWQYYISGKGRMTIFEAGSRARTMDFQAGDVGYVLQSMRTMLRTREIRTSSFLEMFKTPHYEDISLAEWIAHTPQLLVDQHLRVGKGMLASIPKQEIVNHAVIGAGSLSIRLDLW